MANKFAALHPHATATTTHDAPPPAMRATPSIYEQERAPQEHNGVPAPLSASQQDGTQQQHNWVPSPYDDVDPLSLPSTVGGKSGIWNWDRRDPITGKYLLTFVPSPEKPARSLNTRITTNEHGARIVTRPNPDGTVTVKPLDEPDITCTDVGNARRLAQDYAGRLQYVPEWGWLTYRDGVWLMGASGEAMECAKACVQDMLHDAANTANRTLATHAARSMSNRSLKNMLELARSEPGIAATIADFDTNPMLLNVKNGTIDLTTGELRPHNPQDRITKQAPVTYDATATAPRWERFLQEVFNNDDDLIESVQRDLGYSLTGDVREEKFFLCYGGGCNGKSTLLNAVMKSVLGSGSGRYAKPLKARVLAKQPHGEAAHDAEIVDMVGARFVTAQERLTGEMDTSKMKELVSRDPQQVRPPHGMPITIEPSWHIWICTNERPTVNEVTSGIWRRLKPIPFTVSFEGREDRTIEAALAAEASGILNWLLAGCKTWQAEGLRDAEAVKEATREYRQEQDPTLDFFETVLTRAAGNQRVDGATAKAAYDRWKERAGDDAPWLSAKELYHKAEEHGYRTQRSNGKRYVVGCALTS